VYALPDARRAALLTGLRAAAYHLRQHADDQAHADRHASASGYPTRAAFHRGEGAQARSLARDLDRLAEALRRAEKVTAASGPPSTPAPAPASVTRPSGTPPAALEQALAAG
jgi:hypothetical protein